MTKLPLEVGDLGYAGAVGKLRADDANLLQLVASGGCSPSAITGLVSSDDWQLRYLGLIAATTTATRLQEFLRSPSFTDREDAVRDLRSICSAVLTSAPISQDGLYSGADLLADVATIAATSSASGPAAPAVGLGMLLRRLGLQVIKTLARNGINEKLDSLSQEQLSSRAAANTRMQFISDPLAYAQLHQLYAAAQSDNMLGELGMATFIGEATRGVDHFLPLASGVASDEDVASFPIIGFGTCTIGHDAFQPLVGVGSVFAVSAWMAPMLMQTFAFAAPEDIRSLNAAVVANLPKRSPIVDPIGAGSFVLAAAMLASHFGGDRSAAPASRVLRALAYQEEVQITVPMVKRVNAALLNEPGVAPRYRTHHSLTASMRLGEAILASPEVMALLKRRTPQADDAFLTAVRGLERLITSAPKFASRPQLSLTKITALDRNLGAELHSSQAAAAAFAQQDDEGDGPAQDSDEDE